MTIQMLGRIFVFLCISLLAMTADQDCALTSYRPVDGCNCLSASLTCFGDGGNQTLPFKSQIPVDVQVLTLTDYNISTLNTTSMFGVLEDLVNLDLSNNKIVNVTKDSFSGKNFPKLEILSLEGNNVNTTVDASGSTHIFEDLHSLWELNLRKALTRHFVQSDTFIDIFHGSYLRNLKKLNLNGNDIRGLDSKTFHNANKLEELDISDSNLTKIQKGTFTNTSLPKLRKLDLSNNRIKEVMEDLVEDFKTFESKETKVNLTGNPLQCTCLSIKFINWLKNTSLIIEKELLMCHGTQFNETAVIQVDVSEITCTDIEFNETKFRFQYVILCIIFGILGLLALIILFMRRNDILRFCMQVRQATKDAFDSHQTHYTYSGIQNAKRVTPEESGEAAV